MKTRKYFAIIISTLFIVFAQTAGATYFLPYYTDGPGTATGVAVRNGSSSVGTNVEIEVFRSNGTKIDSRIVSLNPDGQWSGVIQTSGSNEGWIRIDSDQKIAGLCFVLKDDAMMDVPFTDDLSTRFIIPHAAQDDIWDTIIYAANPNSAAVTAIIRFYNESGSEVANLTTTIPALGSYQVPLDEILGTTQASGGSVTVESTLGIAAFALFNNRKTNQYSFAGINAVPEKELDDNSGGGGDDNSGDGTVDDNPSGGEDLSGDGMVDDNPTGGVDDNGGGGVIDDNPSGGEDLSGDGLVDDNPTGGFDDNGGGGGIDDN